MEKIEKQRFPEERRKEHMESISHQEKEWEEEAEESSKPDFDFKWQAPEYEHYEKDVSWYWISLTAAVILVFLAIWLRNFLFALFLVIAWPVIVSLAHRTPEMMDFEMDEDGLRVGEDKYIRFREIKGYDINPYNEDYAELVLKTGSHINQFLRIRVPAGQRKKMEKYLFEILPREEYPESFAESVAKILKF